MGRFARSWHIFKASWRVLRSSKALVVFPLLSGLIGLIVMASFVIPAWSSIEKISDDSVPPSLYIAFAGFYLVAAYLTIFFNTALISQANVALSGGEPSVAGGLKVAGANWLRILPWALLSATVSMVLRLIEERLPFVGRFVVSLIGMAWQLVTYLVLPVLVLEQAGTGRSIKRSVELFKRTWGENVLGNVGFGLIGFLAVLPGFALVAFGIAAGGATFLAFLLVAVVWLIIVSIVIAALSGIYQTALYRFAADGAPAPAFADVDLVQSFRQRG